MRFVSKWMVRASALAAMTFGTAASVAQAYECSPCSGGQRYCGEYHDGHWQSGSWESCGGEQPPPPPPHQDCHDQPGSTRLERRWVSSTTCRAVIPGSNECIRAGTPTVSVDHYSCTYQQFNGCGECTGEYTEACGNEYNSCGC
jgi:hypothetical protein